jgi:hypothetical protein
MTQKYNTQSQNLLFVWLLKGNFALFKITRVAKYRKFSKSRINNFLQGFELKLTGRTRLQFFGILSPSIKEGTINKEPSFNVVLTKD